MYCDKKVKIYFFPKETGLAKLNRLKVQQPSAVILPNRCSQKICFQSATLFKERLSRFPANLHNLKKHLFYRAPSDGWLLLKVNFL